MKYTISFDPGPNAKEIQVLGNGLQAFATQKKDLPRMEFFAFFIRDENNQILGGCNGNTLYGCVYIDQIWLDESIRAKGYGTKLMTAAEQFGKEKGCTFS